MIKQIDDELYEVVCGWWVKRGWPIIPRNMIGSDLFIAFSGEKPIMSAVLYKAEGCAYGMLEWFNSNPDSTREERDQVFDGLVEHLTSVGKSKGVAGFQNFTNHRSLKERLLKAGFFETDQEMTGFFKIIEV
jgi:hypothetical protein